jgi:hypothetical protein
MAKFFSLVAIILLVGYAASVIAVKDQGAAKVRKLMAGPPYGM